MIATETVTRPTTVTFYFDPICPWTWITSRWLVEVTNARGVDVDWRTMSLAQLNGGVENMPEQYQEGGRFSMRALRMMEAMRADEMRDRIGEFFTQLGTLLHVERAAPGMDVLQQAAQQAGVTAYMPAADDAGWDDAIAGSTQEAMRLAGPDVGSPVLRLGSENRGMHGPIVSPAPQGEDALVLWDSLVALTHVPGFYEIKHGRSGAPQIVPTEAAAGRAST